LERRPIAERTKDGIAAARAKGKNPGRRPLDADKIAAALRLVKAALSPTAAAKQLGLGRWTVYREVNRAGIERHPAGAGVIGNGCRICFGRIRCLIM
jgi:DNA invertase Pin-like site-specific DNA recombinase